MVPLHFFLVMSVPPFEVHQVCSRGLVTYLQICLRAANRVSPIFENGASGLVYSNVSVKSTADREARPAEDINNIFV